MKMHSHFPFSFPIQCFILLYVQFYVPSDRICVRVDAVFLFLSLSIYLSIYVRRKQ